MSKKSKAPASSSYLSNEYELKKNSKNYQTSIYNDSENIMKIESKKISEVKGLSNFIHSK